MRCYSAAGGLSKEDVEGRITSLLAGFDKVRLLLFLRLAVERREGMRRRLSLICRDGDALGAMVVPRAASRMADWDGLAGLARPGGFLAASWGFMLTIWCLAGQRP